VLNNTDRHNDPGHDFYRPPILTRTVKWWQVALFAVSFLGGLCCIGLTVFTNGKFPWGVGAALIGIATLTVVFWLGPVFDNIDRI
jgi:hypothetical protein